MPRFSDKIKAPESRRSNSALPRYLRLCAWLALLSSSLCLSAQAIEPSEIALDKRLQKRPSVDEVARQISAKLNWRILAAEPTVEDNKTFYRFKLLDKNRGRVQVIVIDPDEIPDLEKFQ